MQRRNFLKAALACYPISKQYAPPPPFRFPSLTVLLCSKARATSLPSFLGRNSS